jgi:CheY-like chemotaxis protein
MAKILVAEDERDIRELIGHTLRFAGFEVVLAANGIEAMALVPGEQPDLIILDVRMPKMTGYDVCRRLKDDPLTGEIPVPPPDTGGRRMYDPLMEPSYR